MRVCVCLTSATLGWVDADRTPIAFACLEARDLRRKIDESSIAVLQESTPRFIHFCFFVGRKRCEIGGVLL